PGTRAGSEPIVGGVEPAIWYSHRKGWERAVCEDFLLHLAEETTAPAAVAGEVIRTIMFVDLSSFTPLTEVMGDTAASRVVDRFSEIVREAAAGSLGKIVKQIGDEFMLVFADGRSAVVGRPAVEGRAAAGPRVPAQRVG